MIHAIIYESEQHYARLKKRCKRLHIIQLCLYNNIMEKGTELR